MNRPALLLAGATLLALAGAACAPQPKARPLHPLLHLAVARDAYFSVWGYAVPGKGATTETFAGGDTVVTVNLSEVQRVAFHTPGHVIVFTGPTDSAGSVDR